VITIAAVRAALVGHRPREEHAPEARPAAVSLVLTGTPEGLAALFIERALRAGDPWAGHKPQLALNPRSDGKYLKADFDFVLGSGL